MFVTFFAHSSDPTPPRKLNYNACGRISSGSILIELFAPTPQTKHSKKTCQTHTTPTPFFSSPIYYKNNIKPFILSAVVTRLTRRPQKRRRRRPRSACDQRGVTIFARHKSPCTWPRKSRRRRRGRLPRALWMLSSMLLGGLRRGSVPCFALKKLMNCNNYDQVLPLALFYSSSVLLCGDSGLGGVIFDVYVIGF